MRPAGLITPTIAPLHRASFSRALILRRARTGAVGPSLRLRPSVSTSARHASTSTASSSTSSQFGQTLENMSAGGTSAQHEGQSEQGLRMLVFGKPGSGKGTLSARLVQNFDISFVSTGDVLRKEIASGSDVGKKAEEIVASGGLVSDELMLEIVMTELDRLRGKSWIIDGFPRTLRQGQLLDEVLAREGRPLNMIVHLNVPDGVIMSRIAARWVHLPSGRVYNTSYSAPKVPGKDDVTGEPLSKRPDDTPETFGKRLKAYYESTAPLLEFFAKLYPKSLISLSGSTSDEVLVAAGLRPPSPFSPSSSSASSSSSFSSTGVPSSSAAATGASGSSAAGPPRRAATPFFAPTGSIPLAAARKSALGPASSSASAADGTAAPVRPAAEYEGRLPPETQAQGSGRPGSLLARPDDPLHRPSSAQAWEGVTVSPDTGVTGPDGATGTGTSRGRGWQGEEEESTTVRTPRKDGVDVVFAPLSPSPPTSTEHPSSSVPTAYTSFTTLTPTATPIPTLTTTPTPPPTSPPPSRSVATNQNPWDRPHSIIWHLPPSFPHPSFPSSSSSSSSSSPTFSSHHPLSHFLPIHLPSSSHPMPHYPHHHRPTDPDPAPDRPDRFADLPPLPSHPTLSPNAIDQLWPQLEALVEPYGLPRPAHEIDGKARIGGAEGSEAGAHGKSQVQSGADVRHKADDLSDPAEHERKAVKGE